MDEAHRAYDTGGTSSFPAAMEGVYYTRRQEVLGALRNQEEHVADARGVQEGS